MKTIGFIKEKDSRIIKIDFIKNLGYDDQESLLSNEEKEKLIHYLNSSEMVFSLTLALFDGQNYIGPYMLFSDGDWVWPSHFAYFLSKNTDNKIDSNFLNHLQKRNFKITPLFEKQKKEVMTFIEGTLLNLKG